MAKILKAVFVTVSILAALMSVVSSASILVSATYGEGSHYMAATAIGESLVKRGHNVTFLIGSAYEHRAQHPTHSKLFNFEIFRHATSPEEVRERFTRIFSQAFNKDFNVAILMNLTQIMAPTIEDCRAALGDQSLMNRLVGAKFDITILDITWSCSVLISAYLNTPIVHLNPLASQYHFAQGIAGAPFIPAVVSDSIFCSPQRMNFKQRVGSFLVNFAMGFLYQIFIGLIDPLREEFGISFNRSVADLLLDTELVLLSMDPVIDVIVPLPPSVIEVGGLLTRPAESLGKDLDDFMNSSGDDGVIILSLGTYVKVMPQRLNDLFADVFSRFPQKVVWQLADGTPTKLGDNIKTLEWLPQNDLLGHPKTKLFIYQGGNNGLYEALYHGVPIIVLPVFGDQLCVATRVTEKGMGTWIDIHSLTTEDLETTIKTVIYNQTYADTAKRLSAIFRDRPLRPADRAAFWVEHVIKFGGKHIRSPSLDLNFVQLCLLDVIAFLVVCFVVTLVIIVFTCKGMFRCLKLSCRIITGRKTKQD